MFTKTSGIKTMPEENIHVLKLIIINYYMASGYVPLPSQKIIFMKKANKLKESGN